MIDEGFIDIYVVYRSRFDHNLTASGVEWNVIVSDICGNHVRHEHHRMEEQVCGAR